MNKMAKRSGLPAGQPVSLPNEYNIYTRTRIQQSRRTKQTQTYCAAQSHTNKLFLAMDFSYESAYKRACELEEQIKVK